jgi:hypothetical protein
MSLFSECFNGACEAVGAKATASPEILPDVAQAGQSLNGMTAVPNMPGMQASVQIAQAAPAYSFAPKAQPQMQQRFG